MAVLKAAERKRAWHLVVNGKIKYPINDKAHARVALARIDQGGLSPAQKARVRARAHKLLGTKKKSA